MFNLFRKKAAVHPMVKQDDLQAYRVRVKTVKNQEIIEFRFTKSAHISVDDDGNYIFRKSIVSPNHFDRGEFTVHFDKNYKVLDVSGDQVSFVPVAEWED